MSYKIGDQFIFTIDRIYSSKKHAESRYGIKGFENFVLSKRKLDTLLKYRNIRNAEEQMKAVYENGKERGIKQGAELAAMHGSDATSEQLEKAFFDGMEEAAKKNDMYQLGLNHAWEVAKVFCCDMDYDQAVDCFGANAADDNLGFFAAKPEIRIKQLCEWQAKIKVGDEVTAEDGTARFFVTSITDGDCISGIDSEGRAYSYLMYEITAKVGHNDKIAELMNAMGG